MPRLALALLVVAALAPAAPVPKGVKTPPVFPHTVGTRWEYVRDVDPKMVWVEEVTESEEKDWGVVFRVELTFDDGEKMFEQYEWKDGVLGVVADDQGTYDPPSPVRRDRMAAGDSWEVTYTQTFRKQWGQVKAVRQTKTLTVGKAEEITTPAGKFTATPVTHTYTDGNPANTFWFADGVGMVRHTTEGEEKPKQELKAFTPAKK